MHLAAGSYASQKAQPKRGRRILLALVAGAGLDEIAAQERISRKRIEKIVRDELSRRWVAPIQDFAKLQIARLENLALKLIGRAQDGDLRAIDRALKILDRLDRYHEFTRANWAVVEPYGEEERERLLNKLNAVAARLRDNPTEVKREE
jgi:hypothetical protein